MTTAAGPFGHGRIAQEAQTAGGHAEPPWLASAESGRVGCVQAGGPESYQSAETV